MSCRAAARAWDSDGRANDDVLRGARLATAIEFVATHTELPPVVAEFVAASQLAATREQREVEARLQREVRNRRRLGRALVASGLLLVVALVGGVLAIAAQRRADDAAALAEQRQSEAEAERDSAQVERLVVESGALVDSNLDRALLLAVEANRREDSPETRGALLTALHPNEGSARAGAALAEPAFTNSAFLGFLTGPQRLQLSVDVSGDGGILASAGFAGPVPLEGMVVVYDTATTTEIGRITANSPFTALDVSDDGRYVLAHTHVDVYLFDTSSRTAVRLPVPRPSADMAEVDEGGTSIARALLRPGSEQFSSSSPATA